MKIHTHVHKDFKNALDGQTLTTAEIIYHMPTHPLFLETYIWQDFDFVPSLPRLIEFLKYWTKSLDGKLHSVRVTAGNTLVPHDIMPQYILSLSQ